MHTPNTPTYTHTHLYTLLKAHKSSSVLFTSYLFLPLQTSGTMREKKHGEFYKKEREEDDNALFITLVPKVIKGLFLKG